MINKNISINNIPAILWGENKDKVYIFVHGKMSDKSSAVQFAEIAAAKGYQVLSFDLPEHGERKDTAYKCSIWNAVRDLQLISDYAQENWQQISLFGCSLGAFFSLHAYKNLRLAKCLFQSPVLDMEHLIKNMFLWFGVTEEELCEKGEIPTPIDVLSWDYYCYVKENPIEKWDVPTAILYGSRDNLQSRAIVDSFANKFGCELEISYDSEHFFNTDKDIECITSWLDKHI